MHKRLSLPQLEAQLPQQSELPHLLLTGNDPYLLYASQQCLQESPLAADVPQHSFEINASTTWEPIFDLVQMQDLFASSMRVVLKFSTTITAPIAKQLTALLTHCTTSVHFVFILEKLTPSIEGGAWFKLLSPLWIISCAPLNQEQMRQWIQRSLHQKELLIDDEGLQLLNYYYEGNLLEFEQIMAQLVLMYGKRSISLLDLESVLNNVARFTVYHWIDAIIQMKPKRAIHILQQLEKEGLEPTILLRTYQRELLQWIKLKKYTQHASLRDGFEHFKIWQNRRAMLSAYLQSQSLSTLYDRLNDLTDIELHLKRDFSNTIWYDVAQLTLRSSMML